MEIKKSIVDDEFSEAWFKRRFSTKDLVFEKKCGYYGEWEVRFASGNPDISMDSFSRDIYYKMIEELLTKRLGLGIF